MSDVLIRREGLAGRITLNRPGALNALTHDMVRRITDALDEWAGDGAVALVIIEGAGERAFCAGGDLRGLYELPPDDLAPARRFWADEYRLNARIARYPKPYVALMAGIVMGGGVGVSAHGSHRIVSETTVLAMPEVTIGFMPDVGGTWLLARAPGRSGLYLGLTGARSGAADAIWTGFADHRVPNASMPDLVRDLARSGDVEAALRRHGAPPETAPLLSRGDDIERAFSGASVQECLEKLRRMETGWARETEATIRRNSPLSLACAFQAIARAGGMDRLEDALRLEYRFSWRSLAETDFREGIRSAIIDRDRNPKWQPPRIEEVDMAKVDHLLSSLGADELDI